MIYLKNNTILQELYIPRQDYISNTTGSSGTYAEGYADGYESGYTSGSTDGFDSGYTEGYSSGETHQKGLLTSTGITENGEYQREDGWSAITVNVSGSVLEDKEIVVSEDITVVTPDSGYDGFSRVTVDATEYGQTNYDSGFDDGFTDGYSSGASEGYDSGYTEGYQSGSTDGFNSGYTSGSTDGYESGYTEGYDSGSTDGFNSGYTSGETHQKSLLGTTAFTINGSYSDENGYSAITVNVPTGQTYNIEQNKPFTATSNGNYTINPSEIWSITYDHTFARRYVFTINGTIPQSFVGDTAYVVRYDDEDTGEEPSVVITIGSGNTLTINKNGWDEDDYGDVDFMLWQGKYRLEFDNDNLHTSDFSIIPYSNREKYDVMSAVTLNVNVETASTYQSGYTSGYTDGYDSGSTDGFNSGYTSGTTDGYQSGYTVGTNDVISTFSSMTATTNGVYGSSANPLSSITVNVPTGSTATLGVGSFSANGTYSASTDNLDGYSAITVNVPQSGSTEKDIVICTSGGCWFTTNYQIDYGDSIEIEHCTFGTPILPYPGTHQQYVGGNSSEVFRIGQNEYGLYLKYFSNFSSGGHIIYFPSSGSILEDNTITFSSTGFTVDGNVVTSYTTTEISSIATLIFFANNSSGGDVVEKQTAKMGRVKVYASDGTLKATFEPRLDNLNVPYFKYVEQDIDIYASGSGTPLYEILDPMYNSGYTDGYTRGYTDGGTSMASLIDRSIKNAVIPSGCTKIGSYAFTYCYSLSSVTIPNTVTEIGNNAFMRNIFSAITIPSGVTKIGDYAFQYCSSLSSVTIPNSVTSIGSNAFASCYSLSSVTISNSVTKIENYVFQYCRSLSSITIPNSVTSIGNNSFDACSVLIEVNIGSGVTIINQRAFRNCSALTNIYISAITAPTISNANAFQGVPSTGTVHYPQGSDYSSWQSNQYLSGWTFVGDL